MEWRPIETAPKDGTELLVHGPAYESVDLYVAPGFWVAFWSLSAIGPG